MKVLSKVLLAFVLASCSLASTMALAEVRETKVYIAHDESAKRVLENMLAMFGRKLIASDMPTRPVSGRFEVKSVEDVMTYFESAYKINWFQNGVNIYTYESSNWKTQRLYVGGQKSNDDWKDLLTSAGLYYKEFPFVFNSDTKELVVSGPSAYVKLVQSAFEQTPPDPSEIEKNGIKLMVFPLKYASVEDRQTNLRGQVMVTPGVLSVLLNLLNLPNQPLTGSPESMKPGALVPNAAGTPIVAPGFTSQQVTGQGTPPVFGRPATDNQPKNDDRHDEDKGPSVTADPRTNSILIRDAKSKYEYYKNLIDQLDKPLPMIEVEAMLVEVDQNSLNELGLEFGLASQHLAYDFPGASVGSDSLVVQPGASSIVSPALFLARLKALAANQHAKVLARPTIVTQDNVPAFIDLSQTLYLQTTGERVASVTPVTAGSMLQVTPRTVSGDNDERIFLRIEIQDGSIIQQSPSVSAPTVQNTTLSTQALIQRDKAILIGGYNRESSREQEYKVPFLGSLPIIGKAFSSTQTKSERLARLFLITPKLIEGSLHDSESSRKAIDQLQMSFKIEDNPTLTPTPSLKIDNTLTR